MLTAAHCFDDINDGKYVGNNHLLNLDEYSRRNKFVVGNRNAARGANYIQLCTTGTGDGDCIDRDKIQGLNRYGETVNFPIPKPKNMDKLPIDTDLIDIAIATLKKDIVFSSTIKKARIASPSNNCKTCTGDCSDSEILGLYGWGKHIRGIQTIIQKHDN